MKHDLSHYRRAFVAQRNAARHKGIGFNLTFEDWLQWWGEDIDRRGKRKNDLQMRRFHDKGAYEIGNIKKGTPIDARTTSGCVRRMRNSLRDKDRHEQYLDSLVFAPCGEKEIRKETIEHLMKTNGVWTRVPFLVDKKP